MLRRWVGLIVFVCLWATAGFAAELRVGTFDVDASPPVGSPLAYDPTIEVETPLSCRGVVLLTDEKPIVLCAIDWIGVSNDSYRVFRESLAKAAGTTPDRVSLHALHQHDAPRSDFSVDAMYEQYGIGNRPFDSLFARQVIARAADAVAEAVKNAQPVTHVGLGAAKVEKVASNRRVKGPDGRVSHVRWSATKDPKVRAAPEGTIDPMLRMVSFWNGDKPVAALTYYATHPQSYYRTGKANPDFPGLARNRRQEATGVPHIHFNGASGNVTAGKYNDGSTENRQILAGRMADAMERAWKETRKTPISAGDVRWQTVPTILPPPTDWDDAALMTILTDSQAAAGARAQAAEQLVWLRRYKAGEKIDLSCLSIGNARVLHMPGELFIEYQLAAQKLRPDLFVAMAAYGEYAPGYIGTAVAYGLGGYETETRSSNVAPEVEKHLMTSVAKLLDVDPAKVEPLKDGGAPAAQ